MILPTYNRAHLLPRALRSVLSQTYVDLEVRVVDDGSTDETPAVVAAYADPRVRYIRRPHQGAAVARNEGIRLAAGEWIALIDSDDEWMPDKLEKQMALAATAPPDVGVIYCGGVIVDDTTQQTIGIRRPLAEGHGWVFDLLLETHWFPTIAVVARRRCFETVGGFDEHLSFGEDREWLLRASRHFQFIGIDEPLVRVHLHEGMRLTGNLAARAAFVEVILERYAAELRSRPLVAARKYVGLGDLYLRGGDPRRARDVYGLALRVRPSFAPAYFHLALSLGPWRAWHAVSRWRQHRRARSAVAAVRRPSDSMAH
ncbi:MAG: glycosyltransferase [Armatimonadota bacterium]|nr:glycosyltransferase [Armatimonadota bacterium]